MNLILITGGLGYIGSHTVVELIRAGYEPLIIDNLSESDLEVKDKIEAIVGREVLFEEVEMCDDRALRECFSRHPDIVGVIHFAAFLYVDESVSHPLTYYRNNLLSTIHLLDLMVELGIGPVVFSSSCTVYGDPDRLPVSEDEAVKEAQSPYGNTKRVCEDILRDVSEVHDIKVMSLRYFNPIGAHESGLIGEFQEGEPRHLVPYLCETALGVRETLKVFGNDYDTRDGSCIRDYIHVVDIARAHVLALENLLNKPESPAFDVVNLGSGSGATVLEMIQSFERVTGIEIPFEIASRRAGDVPAVYADISKAKATLGWEPEHNLDSMLLSAWTFDKKLRG